MKDSDSEAVKKACTDSDFDFDDSGIEVADEENYVFDKNKFVDKDKKIDATPGKY